MRIAIVGIAALAASVMSTGASAATYTYNNTPVVFGPAATEQASATLGPAATINASALQLAKFDESLLAPGEYVESVDIRFVVFFETSGTLTNTADSAVVFDFATDSRVWLNSIVFPGTTNSGNQQMYEEFGISLAAAGNAGDSTPFSGDYTYDTGTFEAAGSVSDYLGAGEFFTLDFQTRISQSFSGSGGNLVNDQNTTATFTAYVDYNITGGATAVPVPAALPLMGAGLAALGFVARRRKS